MFVDAYKEVEPSETTQIVRGAPPLMGSERGLVRAFKGRFCFDFGLATSCLKTTISLREGESYALGVSVGGKWGSLRHDMTYEMERTITYEVGECDSVSPILMYDDSELQVHEVTRAFLGLSWRYNETHFAPGRRPVLCGNQIYDDPACGCSSDRPPTGSPNDRHAMHADTQVSRLLRTNSFAAAPENPVPDPEEAVSRASQMLEESVGNLNKVGIVGISGEPVWLGQETFPLEEVHPALLSTDCNAAIRGRVLIKERDPHYPLLAVMPGADAAFGEVVVYLDEHGDGLVRFLDQPASVLLGQFTTIWSGVDFSEIPAGTSGLLELRLMDHGGISVGQPMRQPFDVIQQPVAATAQEPVPA